MNKINVAKRIKNNSSMKLHAEYKENKVILVSQIGESLFAYVVGDKGVEYNYNNGQTKTGITLWKETLKDEANNTDYYNMLNKTIFTQNTREIIKAITEETEMQLMKTEIKTNSETYEYTVNILGGNVIFSAKSLIKDKRGVKFSGDGATVVNDVFNWLIKHERDDKVSEGILNSISKNI